MNLGKIAIMSVDLAYRSNAPCGGFLGIPGTEWLSGGLGLIDSGLNYFAQKDTNNTNWDIAQATNKANLELYREQVADQYSQWVRENQYNSPSAQVQRFRAAGLNPALMMQHGGTSGNAQAMTLPSVAPSVTGAPMQSPQFHFSDIAKNMLSMAEASKATQEGNAIRMDNQYRDAWNQIETKNKMIGLKIAMNQEKVGSWKWQAMKNQYLNEALNLRMMQETYDERKQSYQLGNEVVRQQANVMKENSLNLAADTAYKKSLQALTDTQKEFLPRDFLLRCQDIMSQINLRASQGQVNIQDANLIFQRALREGIGFRSDVWNQAIQETMWPIFKQQIIDNGVMLHQDVDYNRQNQYLKVGSFLANPLKEGISTLGKFFIGKSIGSSLGSKSTIGSSRPIEYYRNQYHQFENSYNW